MNNLIIYAHPNPASFSNAVKAKVEQVLTSKGQTTTTIDLYADDFDPVLSMTDFKNTKEGTLPPDIQRYQTLISVADRLIFVYPVWWNQMPAILKGFIDRVFSYGFAYAVNPDGSYAKLLTGKKGAIFSSFGTPGEYVQGAYADAMEFTQNKNILGFCGIEPQVYEMFTGVTSVDNQTRVDYLNSIEKLL